MGGELDFLAWLAKTAKAPPQLSVPLGDDAAVWTLPSSERLVVAADAFAEGTHFTSDTDLGLVGRKALCANLSDLAAMGAGPLFALATCALPRGFPDEMPRDITRGLFAAGEEYGCPLIGGDTLTHDGGIVLSVTVLGSPFPGGPITRSGARPGDLLLVTGAFGGSLRSRHLTFVPRLAESRRLLELAHPTAMMDVSDGLLLDLHRLADASSTGFRLVAQQVPVHEDAREKDPDGDLGPRALYDGEDFELLFALPQGELESLQSHWDLETPLTVVGHVLPAERRLVVGGREISAPVRGYEHR